MTDRDVDVTSTDALVSFNHTTRVARTGVNKGAEYEIVTCPNTINFLESFTESSDAKNTAEDVYRVTQNDNDVGLSIEDRKVMEIMEKGIHKNKLGNWEMPLLFLSQNVSMPKNRGYAVKRLTGLLRTHSKPGCLHILFPVFLFFFQQKVHACINPQPDLEEILVVL